MLCVMNWRVIVVVDGVVSWVVSGDGVLICMGVWGVRVICEMVCFVMLNLIFGILLGVVLIFYNIIKY